MKSFCPVCGSDELETTKTSHMLPIVYGNPAVYVETIETCLACGESGDFSGVNDEQIDNAIDIAKKQSVINMLDVLTQNDMKMSYIERALELPVRTIARWKSGDLSAAPLALLRIIRTYPWILEVADAHFDESVAKYRLVEEAAHIIHDVLKPHAKQTQVTYSSNNQQIKIQVEYTPKNATYAPSVMKPMHQGDKYIVGGFK